MYAKLIQNHMKNVTKMHPPNLLSVSYFSAIYYDLKTAYMKWYLLDEGDLFSLELSLASFQ